MSAKSRVGVGRGEEVQAERADGGDVAVVADGDRGGGEAAGVHADHAAGGEGRGEIDVRGGDRHGRGRLATAGAVLVAVAVASAISS